MSLSEFFVVCIIALILIKPGDLPLLLRKLQKCKQYLFKIKQDVASYFHIELKKDDTLVEYDVSEINFYLEKIINIDGQYEGEYSIDALKSRYHELINDSICKNKS